MKYELRLILTNFGVRIDKKSLLYLVHLLFSGICSVMF